MAQTGQFTATLAVVQQKLITSRVNDAWGFELLQSVVRYIPSATLKLLIKGVVTMLLTRLQTAGTDAYVYDLVYFLRIHHGRRRPGFLDGGEGSGSGSRTYCALLIAPCFVASSA